jgi:hypothetical protein
MNDQHPPLHVGDRVTLHDPRHAWHGLPLTVVDLMWCEHAGEWFASAANDNDGLTVHRRADSFHRGWA